MPLELNKFGMVVDPERPHLGGFFRDGDPGCRYPDLWRWLVEEYDIRSAIDVGCGGGGTVRYLTDELGIEAVGIDGIIEDLDDARFIQHDYASGPYELAHRDLCWSCEFVEHVEERFVPNFLATFACAEFVLMTHAIPGQGGHHHVNCKDDSYWIGALAAIGYEHDAQLTAVTKEIARKGYWSLSGLAFKRAS